VQESTLLLFRTMQYAILSNALHMPSKLWTTFNSSYHIYHPPWRSPGTGAAITSSAKPMSCLKLLGNLLLPDTLPDTVPGLGPISLSSSALSESATAPVRVIRTRNISAQSSLTPRRTGRTFVTVADHSHRPPWQSLKCAGLSHSSAMPGPRI
jgi:hypothetical protein